MTDIDVTQYATYSEAGDAAEAAFAASNPEPTKPEKKFSISRPALIEAEAARLWVEVRMDSGYSGDPRDPRFTLRSHGTVESVQMDRAEINALIEQLSVKLGELEAAEEYKASYDAYRSAHSQWEQKKNEAYRAGRAAWQKHQEKLEPTPDPEDYTGDDIEEEDWNDDDNE